MRLLAKTLLYVSPLVLTLAVAMHHAEAEGDVAPQDGMGGDLGLSIPMTGDTMNGYSIKQFAGFETKWHFVTPRYRKDISQIRMVYANDIAWKALKAHVSDYPDGAVFAKIAFSTIDDPSFTSSAIPSGSLRYQFMVRDHKKHKDTDGWGYAIFDGAGHGTEINVETNSQACAACHAIVPERGFVFSLPVSETVKGNFGPVPAASSRPTFVAASAEQMPPAVREHLPPGASDIRQMKLPSLEKVGPANKLGEMRPALLAETMKTQLPAVLVNESGTAFAATYLDPARPDCTADDGKKGVMVKEFLLEGGHVTPVDYCAPAAK